MTGVVEAFEREGMRGWVGDAEAVSKRIDIKVNGVTIAAAVPVRPIVQQQADNRYVFSRQLKELWKYLGVGDVVTVEYLGTPLPIMGHGLQYVYEDRRRSRTAKLLNRINSGYVFNKYGRLHLSIQRNQKWQDAIFSAFASVRADVKKHFQYELFPIYGTMLGAVREGAFIGHDNDFDVVYISRKVAPEDVKAEFFDICTFLIERGFNLKARPTHTWVRLPGTRYKFDINFSWFSDDDEYQLSYGYHGPPVTKSAAFFELEERSISGHGVMLPRNCDRILNQIYGEGWRVPDPGFNHLSSSRKLSKVHLLDASRIAALHWKQFYLRDDVDGETLFAGFLAARLKAPSLIIDFGCGSGRDAIFFGRQGHTVLAADRAAEALRKVEEKRVRSEGAEISSLGFDAECPESVANVVTAALSRRSADTKRPLVVYMRFFMHAITLAAQDVVLGVLRDLLPHDALLALEFRTEKDQATTKVFGTHYRRYIPMADMLHALSSYGFAAHYQEESQGLSPFERGLKKEDPFLCRILACRREAIATPSA